MLARLCDEQIAQGVAAQRIIVAGFSQGGAIALHAGLRYAQSLGGIMALSTYLPMQRHLEQEAAAANRQTPVFMAHGLNDEVVALQFGLQTRALLEQLGYPVQWHDYAMGHSVCIEEITDIGNWLVHVLAD
jgi:phospholipase/carboxylesterase